MGSVRQLVCSNSTYEGSTREHICAMERRGILRTIRWVGTKPDDGAADFQVAPMRNLAWVHPILCIVAFLFTFEPCHSMRRYSFRWRVEESVRQPCTVGIIEQSCCCCPILVQYAAFMQGWLVPVMMPRSKLPIVHERSNPSKESMVVHDRIGCCTCACVENRFGTISSIATMSQASMETGLREESKDAFALDLNGPCIILSVGVTLAKALQ